MTHPGSDSRAERLRQAIQLKKAAVRPPALQLPPRPADQDAHLGEMQRSLWLQQQLEPSSPAYNLTSAFRVSGVPDDSEIERGLNQVVSRHRLLRSTFRGHRDSALQIVHPQSRIEVERVASR